MFTLLNAGTIFPKSSTSLWTWFNAIYLMASTRCGTFAKQIERKNGTGRPMRGDKTKTPILGMVQRKGGAMAMAVTDTTAKTLVGNVHEHVLLGSTMYTDELAAYNTIPGNREYTHRRINHSTKIYVRGDIYTNSVEGFWSLIKRQIGGV